MTQEVIWIALLRHADKSVQITSYGGGPKTYTLHNILTHRVSHRCLHKKNYIRKAT